MAELDLDQRGVRIDDAELLALLARAEGTAPHPRPADLVAADESLAAAGALVEGALEPTVARMMAILGTPAMEMHLECFIVARTYALDVSLTRDGAVFSRTTDDGLTELKFVDLVDTPFELLRAVGLGRRNDPPCDHSITVPVTALTELAAAGEPDGAAGVDALVAAGVDRNDAELVVLLLMQRRLSFRLTSQWREDADHIATKELAVVDGGRVGLWFTDADLTTGIATLTPTTVRDVVAAVAGLTPVRGIAGWN